MKTRIRDNFFYKNILVVVNVILALLQNGKCITDECIGASNLGDTRRTITEDPGTCGGLCDNNINEDTWYRLDASNSGARMPESFVEVWHCGTYIPIWLNGAHPTETYPGPVTLPVCAQLRVRGPTCEWQSQIRVKRCNDGTEYFVYKLKATPYCDMAYCAGNGINCANNGSWNDITNSCINPPTPPLAVNPRLSNPYISERKMVTDDDGNAFTATKFSMKCTLDYSRKTDDDGARYDVIFESNGQVVYKQTLSSTSLPEVEMSETHLTGRVGQTVTCKVTSYWKSQFPARSPYRISNSFKFDMYFSEAITGRRTPLTIAEGKAVKLTVKTSFMITTPWCFNLQAGNPCYPYYSFTLSSQSLLLSVCKFKIANDSSNTATSGDIWVSSVPDASTGGDTGFIYFQTNNIVQAQNSIFASYTSEKYMVKINDPTAWLSCESYGDPHIVTFGSALYHIYLEGDFILLKVPSRKIEIHVRLFRCNGVATCNCGVIAREGNNILGINSCGSSTLVERYLYDETNPGGTIRHEGGNLWTITLPSGLIIIVFVYEGIIDLTVRGNGIDNYEGLCAYNPSMLYCTTECNTKFRVRGPASLFSYSQQNPPPCLTPKPPIVPQCYCINGDSPSRICDRPDPTDLVSPTLDINICKSQSARRKRQSGSAGSNTTFDENFGINPPNLQWPTPKNKIYERDAIESCYSGMRKSFVYDLCVTRLQVNVTPIIVGCVADIQLTDDIDFQSKSLATQLELYCKGAIDSAVNGTQDSVRKEFVSNFCPMQCSQNGICKNGQCECNSGYMNDDCSVSKGQIPYIQSLVSATCDVRENSSCRVAHIQAVNVSSRNVVCQFKVATEVIYVDNSPSVSGFLVKCNVPLVPVIPNLLFKETVTDYTVYVSISNDATSNEYSNEKKFIIYDGLCVSCSVSDGCSNRTTACNILGRCYEPEAEIYCGKNKTDPRVCDPAVSTSKWLPKDSRIESKGSTTCSSSRPTAATLIIFFSYLFIKLIKDKYAK